MASSSSNRITVSDAINAIYESDDEDDNTFQSEDSCSDEEPFVEFIPSDIDSSDSDSSSDGDAGD